MKGVFFARPKKQTAVCQCFKQLFVGVFSLKTLILIIFQHKKISRNTLKSFRYFYIQQRKTKHF